MGAYRLFQPQVSPLIYARKGGRDEEGWGGWRSGTA